MSAVNQRTKYTTRHEYAILQPSCWTDVMKAFDQAAADRKSAGLSNDYDDVIRVTHDDDNIVVFWEEEAA